MTILKVKQLPTIICLVFLTFFSLFYVADAQTSTTTEDLTEQRISPETRGDNIQERQAGRVEAIEQRQEVRTERIETRQTVREERQAALTSIKQQRILNLAANISNRMEAAIERIFNIIDRLETRIKKLNELGINTSSAEARLREAAQVVSEARAKLNNIDSLVQNATTAAEPKTAWQTVRQTYIETGSLIRKSHQSLREVITLLKAAIAEADLNRNTIVENSVEQATSTPAE
jgi:hypothetical protein